MSIEVIDGDNQDRYPSVSEIAQRVRERKLGQKSIDNMIDPEIHLVPEYLTHSTTVLRAENMRNDGLLNFREVSDVRNFWDTATKYYAAHHLEQKTPVKNQDLATKDAIWSAAGIKTIDETTKNIGGIPVDNLRESIISGNIKALFKPGGEFVVHSMAKLLEHITGLPTQPGEFDNSRIEAAIESLVRRHKVLQEMVNEAADNTYAGKHYGGPYKSLYAPIIEETLAMITDIHPDLDTDALHSTDYRNEHTKKTLGLISGSDSLKVSGIARWRFDTSIQVAEQTWHNDQQQIIPPGLFDRPRETKHGDSRACAAAVFRMIHQGITGMFVGEDELRSMIKQQHLHEFVPDEEYLKLFETEAFKNEYGHRVQSLQFMGMTLDTLRTIAERKRTQYDDINIFAVANLATESNRGDLNEISARIQHRVVVYGADEDYVYVLDPNHPNDNQMDKKKFCKRWSITQNSGYLVLSKPQTK